MRTWTRYWFEIVELPRQERRWRSGTERLRVLLVEDDEDDYLITRDMLAAPGPGAVRRSSGAHDYARRWRRSASSATTST